MTTVIIIRRIIINPVEANIFDITFTTFFMIFIVIYVSTALSNNSFSIKHRP